MRSYLASRGYRQIPVGYSAADVDSNRLEMAEYMNCGTDDERSDFFAFNDYSWCDPSDFQISGWDQKVKNFTGYGLPLFLSEYGCITNKRQFKEVASLYSTDMTSVYSGGLAYEYTEEENKFGLVKISGNTITKKSDYNELQKMFKNTANPTGDGGYNSTGGASGCPPQSATWNVTSDALPAMPVAAEKYMKSGAGTGIGLEVKTSSQEGTKVDGGMSDGIAESGSGTASGAGSGTAGGSSPSGTKNAAAGSLQPLDKAPLFLGMLLASFGLVGAALL
jgi:hypothetical protein